jgi:hypothetical protein
VLFPAPFRPKMLGEIGQMTILYMKGERTEHTEQHHNSLRGKRDLWHSSENGSPSQNGAIDASLGNETHRTRFLKGKDIQQPSTQRYS